MCCTNRENPVPPRECRGPVDSCLSETVCVCLNSDQGKPVNVFTLNTELEASQALFYVETLLLAGHHFIFML